MNKEEKYSDLAVRESLCMNEDCPVKTQCLRWVLREYISPERRYLRVVNPLRVANVEGECLEFKSAEITLLARGFTHMFDNISTSKAKAIKSQLLADLTTIGYYRLKRGDRPLTTAERMRIEEVCREAGVTEPVEFDTWEEGIE